MSKVDEILSELLGEFLGELTWTEVGDEKLKKSMNSLNSHQFREKYMDVIGLLLLKISNLEDKIDNVKRRVEDLELCVFEKYDSY